jgi:hypothetical protein
MSTITYPAIMPDEKRRAAVMVEWTKSASRRLTIADMRQRDKRPAHVKRRAALLSGVAR